MTGSASPDQGVFAPQVLREYALLADGQWGALVGPRGDIVWMCAPRWDSGALFSALLGGRSGYSVTPTGRFVWGGFYEEGRLIWRSRWSTHTGIIECREALAFPGQAHRAVLLRRSIAVDGDAQVQVTPNPRAGFDADPLTDLLQQEGVWTAATGDLQLRWTGAGFCRPSFDPHQGLIGEPAGGHLDLVLEISDQPLPTEPVDPDPGLGCDGKCLGRRRSRAGGLPERVDRRRVRLPVPARCPPPGTGRRILHPLRLRGRPGFAATGTVLPRNSTPADTNSAATCPRRSSTPCTWKPPPNSPSSSP